MSKKKPYPLRKLLKKLKRYGIQTLPGQRGKGSERILFRPEEEGSLKGPQFPIKDHGPNTQIHIPVIQAIIRRFDIKDFWEDSY